MGQMDLQRVTFKTFEQICLLAANREEKKRKWNEIVYKQTNTLYIVRE